MNVAQKKRVQNVIEFFVIANGYVPTSITEFDRGSFHSYEREYAKKLLREIKKAKNKKSNPSHDKKKKFDKDEIFQSLMRKLEEDERQKKIDEAIFDDESLYYDEDEKERRLQIIMNAAIGYINRAYCSFINRFYDVEREQNVNIFFISLDNVVGSSYNPWGITDPLEQHLYEKYYPDFFKEGRKNQIIYFELMHAVVEMYKDDMQKLLQVVEGFGSSRYKMTRDIGIKRFILSNNDTMKKINNFVLTDEYFNNQLGQLQ